MGRGVEEKEEGGGGTEKVKQLITGGAQYHRQTLKYRNITDSKLLHQRCELKVHSQSSLERSGDQHDTTGGSGGPGPSVEGLGKDVQAPVLKV